MEDARVKILSQKLKSSQKILTALGDENRQYLMLEMMKTGDCSGIQAAEIAKRSHLSRQAVSHHLQIMKDAGLLKTRKEQTKIFYYFDPDMNALKTLMEALQLGMEITKDLPDRSGE